MTENYPPPLIVARSLSRGLESLQRKEVVGEDARQELGRLLQSALHLEFATVAPYLSAAFSIVEENEAIQQLIARVAKEEMLHMTAVANLMNAIGIAPDIVGAVPDYPFDLRTIEPPLHLVLESFSFDLVKDLFMKIEAPEEPVIFPAGLESMPPKTIGQFYEGIIKLIESDTIPDLFINAERDAYKQIEATLHFSPIHYLSDQDNHDYPLAGDINFLINDKESAVRHLTWIVSEGEGADKFNPLGPEGIPGHYYRFESILRSKYLIKDTTVTEGYSYSGGALPFSSAGVHEFDPNAKVENYAAHPRVERHMKRFNDNYSKMIDFLESAFNCPAPDQQDAAKEAYQDALDIMRGMHSITTAIIRNAKEEGIKAGIPFQYTTAAPLPT